MTEHQVIDQRNVSSEVENSRSYSSAEPGDRGGRYLFLLITIPLVLYLLPIALVRVPGYIRWAGSQYSPALEYSYTTAGQNADVVIFGDSSALEGIAPVRMSEELGLKVINLPNTGPSLPVVGDLPLRYYLSVNRPPKLILFYFTPWDLQYENLASKFYFEGEEMLFRHGSAKEIAAFVVKHPFTALEWPIQEYSAGPKAAAIAALRHQDRLSSIKLTRGHLESAATSSGGSRAISNLTDSCTLPAKMLGEDSSSVLRLISRYSSGTKVKVFVAPIPACDHARLLVNRSYAAVNAAPPKVLPPQVFRDDMWYAHLDPIAVPATTDTLTAVVKRTLADEGAGR